jgi:methylase of polypeptide subunit release factors
VYDAFNFVDEQASGKARPKLMTGLYAQDLWAPRVVPHLIRDLRRSLLEAGLTEDGVRSAGTADAWSLGAGQSATDGSPFSSLLTLLWLGAPVEASQARAALEPLRLEDLETLGVADLRDGHVRPRCVVRPVDGLLVASDLPTAHADPVLGNVPASDTLARLTVRRPAGRALDLGSGCGVQGLQLARHSQTVISVDVNPRALAFTAFNAALNETINLETREGSWFAPVAGERFDTITCNPPYVISPDTTYTYRDGGLRRDEVCRMVVREAARHLADEGVATVLCNWIHESSWSDPLRSWVADTGCDALLLHYATVDPPIYAANWNAELRRRAPATFEATVRRWIEYYAAEHIPHIGVGAVILRRRQGGRHWVRALDMGAGPTCQSSDDILRLFNASDFLEQHRGPEIFRHAYAPLEGHRVDQVLGFSGGKYAVGPAVFRRVPGIGLEVAVDARVLEVVLECDGRRVLEELAAETARRRGETVDAVRSLVEAPIRQLIERGFMLPRDERKGEYAC